jgi:hypothetical protein
VRAIAPYYDVLVAAHAHARSVPADPRWPAIAAILDDMMRAVIANGAGRTALTAAHTELDALLAAG